MNIGVQYYRAPFPDKDYWENDLKHIRESGFDTVQLWLSWGWIESSPDRFVFDDYDRLVDLAGKNHLNLVLSTIAEIQPNWIHRIIPNSEMIDNMGQKVISSGRNEHHFGITPGGCTDNPAVWQRMKRFIQETGKHYCTCQNLSGWDIWNELRWNIQSDGFVCYCPHTLAAFRQWLQERFGSLDALNDAWLRRYDSWEDVMPGKMPGRPYTEMMAFTEFITERANRHGSLRYKAMREVDPIHEITAHGSKPCVISPGDPVAFPLDRGNDWALADRLDGIGCSSFPQWWDIDDIDFALRIAMVQDASREKKLWLSELQGGRASIGFSVFNDVTATRQQHWLWNGLACGADKILFWCWRDEVFGTESAGFGIAGNDGFAGERLQAMKKTSAVLEHNKELFDGYRPIPAEVGIFFNPRAYYLGWSQEVWGGRKMELGITGYARALTKQSIPIRFVEAFHLDELKGLKILFMPRAIVLDDEQITAITSFVENGGTILVDSECGAFDARGFYRYPEKRFLQKWGIQEIGRRHIDASTIRVSFKDKEYSIGTDQWLTPLKDASSNSLLSVHAAGKGTIIHIGTYSGNAYRNSYCPEFERLVADIVSEANVRIPVKILSPAPEDRTFLYAKCGLSGNGIPLLFLFFPDGCKQGTIEISSDLLTGSPVKDLMSGKIYSISSQKGNGMIPLTVIPGNNMIAVLSLYPNP